MTDPSRIPISSLSTDRLKTKIEEQEETVAKLRAAGHVCTDAERYLNRLRVRLNHLKD